MNFITTRVKKSDKYFSDLSRSVMDDVRYRLQALGYDGIIHNDKPIVNIDELNKKW